MNQAQLKQKVASAALSYVPRDGIIGVGTGSTVNFFIDKLAEIKNQIEGAVASSNVTAERLKDLRIPLVDLNSVDELSVYIDGTDEFNSHRCLTKGGGGALTREKIIAAAARKFVCIADESKSVALLGSQHPIPIEVIPMARSYVARQLVKLGGDPVYRENTLTDNGNVILDVYNLKILNPIQMEQTLNNIAGIVCNGIFAQRPADILLIATASGIETLSVITN